MASFPELRAETIDDKYDFVAYMFVAEEVYYPGVLISEDIVITYQTQPVSKPKICFKQKCAEHVRDSWSGNNFYFWQLTAKRMKPSIYKDDLDPTECYIPPELGFDGFIEFDVIDDGLLECYGHCVSGDALICGYDLYGMVTERDSDNTFNYLTVADLEKMVKMTEVKTEKPITERHIALPDLKQPTTERRKVQNDLERRSSLAVPTRHSFKLFQVVLHLFLVYYL
ncbi:hypothetical protein Trydic_g9266 [Trypoxylus dichotomus]